jgi:uncharacterized iron-regulated membrane protein
MLRTLHRRIALIFSPFFLLTALTGIFLLFRKDELYSKETKSLLIGLHNWEYGAKYIGIILALALITVTISGILLFLKTKKF